MWQPIETAPKDETTVLLAGGIIPGQYVGGEGWPDEIVAASFDGFDWEIVSYDYGAGSVRYENPTHWQPLPEPPQSS